MDVSPYRIIVSADDPDVSTRAAAALADVLRTAEGVQSSDRAKANNESMDLGSIVSILATSGATLAIAQGIAAWLRARRGTAITIERKTKSESIKVACEGIDPETAERIVEKTIG